MIKSRVRVVNKDGGFTIVVCAESLREVEQIARARYAGSAVEIAFPIDPEGFFAGGPQTGAPASGRQGVDRPDKAVVVWHTGYAPGGRPRLA